MIHSRNAPLLVSGLLSACAYIYLSSQSQSYAEAGYFELWAVSVFCAALCFACWFYHHKTRIPVSIKALLFWALCFRIIAFTGFPIMEDDFYRYLWDGRMQAETGDAYSRAPAESFADESLEPRFEEILDRINYPEIKTVYGPVCQWLFALSYRIAPGELWPLQSILTLLDFALILILLRLAPAKFVLLYAWSPLIIKEFAFTAHTDILGVFFLFAAILARQKNSWNLAALLLALAVGSKIFAIVLVPLLLGLNWRAWLSFLVGIVLITLPFLSIDPWFPEGLSAMANQWLFNAPIYSLFINLIPASWLKIGLMIVFILGWCLYARQFNWRDVRIMPRGDLLFALLLLSIPVVNAWYLVWILPFAVIYPSRTAWVASIVVLLSYSVGLAPEQQLSVQILTVEYGIILAALVYDLFKPIKKLAD